MSLALTLLPYLLHLARNFLLPARILRFVTAVAGTLHPSFRADVGVSLLLMARSTVTIPVRLWWARGLCTDPSSVKSDGGLTGALLVLEMSTVACRIKFTILGRATLPMVPRTAMMPLLSVPILLLANLAMMWLVTTLFRCVNVKQFPLLVIVRILASPLTLVLDSEPMARSSLERSLSRVSSILSPGSV